MLGLHRAFRQLVAVPRRGISVDAGRLQLDGQQLLGERRRRRAVDARPQRAR